MNISDRILELIELLNLTSSEFADAIQVQRSSISHITSGRNKPSLDFIEKLHHKYPDLQTEWLLFGKGFPFHQSSKKESPSPTLFTFEDETEMKKVETPITKSESLRIENSEPTTEKNQIQDSQSFSKKIKTILILYNDGSFEEVKP